MSPSQVLYQWAVSTRSRLYHGKELFALARWQMKRLVSSLIQDSSADKLIEANLVDGEDGVASSTGPLVTAKRDSWCLRNQWWLAGALAVVTVAIIVSIVLISVDLCPSAHFCPYDAHGGS
jgi:hypothetical protein